MEESPLIAANDDILLNPVISRQYRQLKAKVCYIMARNHNALQRPHVSQFHSMGYPANTHSLTICSS